MNYDEIEQLKIQLEKAENSCRKYEEKIEDITEEKDIFKNAAKASKLIREEQEKTIEELKQVIKTISKLL